MSIDIAGLRGNYTRGGLSDDDIPEDPISLFRQWVEVAVKSEIDEPNGMSLATVSKDGSPNVRIVLLKGIGSRSIRFFTNYNSSKGRELDANPVAAVSFWWPELERQIRIRGTVNKLSRDESDKYFQSRPRESQLGAWASEQSSVVENREKLREAYESISKRFKSKPIPTPEFWGGYQLILGEIEFWQGRPSRLHDRILFTYEQDKWNHRRLQP